MRRIGRVVVWVPGRRGGRCLCVIVLELCMWRILLRCLIRAVPLCRRCVLVIILIRLYVRLIRVMR